MAGLAQGRGGALTCLAVGNSMFHKFATSHDVPWLCLQVLPVASCQLGGQHLPQDHARRSKKQMSPVDQGNNNETPPAWRCFKDKI